MEEIKQGDTFEAFGKALRSSVFGKVQKQGTSFVAVIPRELMEDNGGWISKVGYLGKVPLDIFEFNFAEKNIKMRGKALLIWWKVEEIKE